jgi:hypothetical protein
MVSINLSDKLQQAEQRIAKLESITMPYCDPALCKISPPPRETLIQKLIRMVAA